MTWKTEETNKGDNWVEFYDPEGWYSATVRWDGCIGFRRFFNSPADSLERRRREDDVDGLHICDIDEMIEQLTALKAKAKEYFGEDWPNI